MIARRHIAAGVATVALTAVSVSALAAAGGAGPYRSTGSWVRTSAACPVPSLPGQHVNVLLADMGGPMGPMMGGRWMMLATSRATVAAGKVSLVGLNQGTRRHELLVLPLVRGASIGERPVRADRSVNEDASLGEASKDCGSGAGPGAGDGIRPGDAGWVTLTLRPGRYELVCNRPGHYRAGMFAELTVT